MIERHNYFISNSLGGRRPVRRAQAEETLRHAQLKFANIRGLQILGQAVYGLKQIRLTFAFHEMKWSLQCGVEAIATRTRHQWVFPHQPLLCERCQIAVGSGREIDRMAH